MPRRFCSPCVTHNFVLFSEVPFFSIYLQLFDLKLNFCSLRGLFEALNCFLLANSDIRSHFAENCYRPFASHGEHFYPNDSACMQPELVGRQETNQCEESSITASTYACQEATRVTSLLLAIVDFNGDLTFYRCFDGMGLKTLPRLRGAGT